MLQHMFCLEVKCLWILNMLNRCLIGMIWKALPHVRGKFFSAKVFCALPFRF